jgi:hypothetical protein
VNREYYKHNRNIYGKYKTVGSERDGDIPYNDLEIH